MSLPPALPIVSVSPGPVYAQDVNDSLTWLNNFAITPIPIPSGVNVIGNLGFNGFGITSLSKLGLTAGTVSTADALYASTISTVDELFWNDNKGHTLQMTKNGALNVSLNGGITTLTGTAALNFTGGTPGTFQFLSSTTRMAALQTGPISLFDSASPIPAHAWTIASPGSLAADHTVTLPAALPASTLPVVMDTGGVLSTQKLVNAQVAFVPVRTTIASLLLAGWTDVGDSYFYTDVGGVVHFQGAIRFATGAGGTDHMFTLPSSTLFPKDTIAFATPLNVADAGGSPGMTIGCIEVSSSGGSGAVFAISNAAIGNGDVYEISGVSYLPGS